MKDQFINSKIIGIIYKNLVTKLNLNINSLEKQKLTKRIINVMNQVYKNVDESRVNQSNFKSILRQFINNSYMIVYNDLNNEDENQENFQPDSRMDRDRQIMGERKNRLDPRNMGNDKYASLNDGFMIDPRKQTNGYRGRMEPDSYTDKGDFSKDLSSRYEQLQQEYRNFNGNNRKPPTPPELKGDGGANLNRYAKERIQNRNNERNEYDGRNSNQRQMSAQEFLKPMDPRAKGGNNNISKDTFNFGTANDMDNNYDTIDGRGINFEGNMNQWNTGIDPKKFNIDENMPLEKRLKQYEAERASLEKPNRAQRKQVKFDDESFRKAKDEEVRSRNIEDDEYENNEREQRMMEMSRNRRQNIEPIREPMRQVEQRQSEEYEEVDDRINEYENTIQLLLGKLNNLQKQQIKYMDNGGNETDDKIRLLEDKKEEIMEEVQRLQNMTLDLEKQQQSIQEKEQRIKLKEKDLEKKMKKLMSLKGPEEKPIIIKASSGKFTYTLDDSIKNIIGLQLINYNIPVEDNNITDNNNRLYFSVVGVDNIDKQNKNTDDDDDAEYLDEVYINDNKINMITIPEDSYDIYGLIDMLNKIGNKIGIYFSLIKGRVAIRAENTGRVKLYMDREYPNNILPTLGFSKIIGDKNKHIAEKKYNLNNDKLIELYIKNISSEPFAEFLIGSSKIHKFSKELKLESLSKLDIEVKLNGKTYMPQEPYLLEFNIVMNNNFEVILDDDRRDNKKVKNKNIKVEESSESEKEEIDTDDGDLLSNITKKIDL